jgi:hypothetical protein
VKLKIAIISILILGSFTCVKYTDQETLLIGKWKYTSVTKGDKELFPINEGDVMVLDSNFSFSYKIASANKDAKGFWSLAGNDTLKLEYHPEGNVRSFVVEKLDSNNLVFFEGDVYFYYEKSEE